METSDGGTGNKRSAIRVASFNCNGLKSNFELVKNLCNDYDVIFLQELLLLDVIGAFIERFCIVDTKSLTMLTITLPATAINFTIEEIQ